MKKIIILLLALTVSSVFAQETAKERFNIFSAFPVNVTHLYDFTENTTVKRTFSDSSTFEYKKFIVYHMNYFAPNKPNDGFQEVRISVDSLKFRFTDEKDTVSYNSQSDEQVPPFNIFAYEKASIYLGKEYFLHYNPYYEVINLSGERLEAQRYRLNDEKHGMRDPIRKYVWEFNLSDPHLTFNGDIRKGLFPPFRASEDTTWKTEVQLEVDGIMFKDSVEMRFDEFTIKNYNLSGESIEIEVPESEVVLHAIKAKSKVLGGKGNVSYNLKVSPKGFINYLQIDIDVKFKLEIENEIFEQHYITTYTWELGNMYTFR
jgi:hypothetical protein